MMIVFTWSTFIFTLLLVLVFHKMEMDDANTPSKVGDLDKSFEGFVGVHFLDVFQETFDSVILFQSVWKLNCSNPPFVVLSKGWLSKNLKTWHENETNYTNDSNCGWLNAQLRPNNCLIVHSVEVREPNTIRVFLIYIVAIWI